MDRGRGGRRGEARAQEASQIARLGESVWAWLQRFSIAAGHQRAWVERIEVSRLCVYGFANTDPARVELIARLIAWLFLFDDACAERSADTGAGAVRERHQRLEGVLAGTQPAPDTPFGQGLADILSEARRRAPVSWVRRLGASIRSYFDGCEVEATLRERKVAAGLEEYLWFRERSVGVDPMLDCVEFANGSFLAGPEARSPLVAGFRHQAKLVSALTNDLFSAEKERREAAAFNSVLVFERQHATSRSTAMEAIEALRQQHLHAMEHFAAALEGASSQLAAFLEGTRVWIDGNHRWSAETRRYHAPPSEVVFVPTPSTPGRS